MKYTGYYCRMNAYELDHEINIECDNLTDIIKGINDNGSEINRKAILKAMLETILNEL